MDTNREFQDILDQNNSLKMQDLQDIERLVTKSNGSRGGSRGDPETPEQQKEEDDDFSLPPVSVVEGQDVAAQDAPEGSLRSVGTPPLGFIGTEEKPKPSPAHIKFKSSVHLPENLFGPPPRPSGSPDRPRSNVASVIETDLQKRLDEQIRLNVQL